MPVKKSFARRYGIGSLYVKGEYWYISFSAKHATRIGLKSRYIATNQAATPTGRAVAERMRRKLSDDYYRAIGLLPREERQNYNPEPLPVEPALDEHFVRFRKEQTGKSKEKTLINYELAYRKILGEVCKSRTWRTEWQPVVRNFTLRRDINANTQNIYLRGLSVFIHWLTDEKILEDGAVDFLRLKKHAQKKVPKEIKIYTKKEVEKILLECAKYKDDRHNKLAYMIRLMLAAAVRIHEVFEMKRDDWQFETGQLRIMDKHGTRYEYVPITDELTEIYREMTMQYQSKSNEPMFGYSSESANHFRRLFQEVATAVKIKLNGRSFHEFKKTYISNLITTKGEKFSTFEIARLSRCSVSVIEKHYLILGIGNLREKLESSTEVAQE